MRPRARQTHQEYWEMTVFRFAPSSSTKPATTTHDDREDLGGWVTSLALSPNGSDVLAATFGRDAALHLLSRREGRLEMMARGALGSPIAWCAVLAGDLFVTASESKLLHAWRPRPNRALNRGRPKELLEVVALFPAAARFGSPDGVGGQGAVHADTATLAVGDEAGRLYVLDLDVDGHFKTVSPPSPGGSPKRIYPQ